MANIPGAANALPSVFSEVETQSRGGAAPGGSRVVAIIGEGEKTEVIVSAAIGSGRDGFDPTYSFTSGADGRHFKLSSTNIVSSSFKLYKNGSLLNGVKQTISTSPFDGKYDYRFESNGKIELQSAHIVDQGGDYFTKSFAKNKGTITGLSITDINAPSETWTIKCVSIQRTLDGSNVIKINETAKFVAIGSVSGTKLDANGNPVFWTANGISATNSILQFAITASGSSDESQKYDEGDYFTVVIGSGVLLKNDRLVGQYISTASINNPTYLTSMDDVLINYGEPSENNTLSLASQLAFANGAPGVFCVQAKPAIPVRASYVLTSDYPASLDITTDAEAQLYAYPVPSGMGLDVNADVHFFEYDVLTKKETQLLLNKFPYYTVGTPSQPSLHTFVNSGLYNYSYTVIKGNTVIATSDNAIVTGINLDSTVSLPSSATISLESGGFSASLVGSYVRLDGSYYNNANSTTATGTVFKIVSVSGGKATIVPEPVSSTFKFIGALSPLSDITGESGLLSDPTTNVIVNSGTSGAILPKGLNNNPRVTGLTGMTPASVGRFISISGDSVTTNNRTYLIVEYIDSTTVGIAEHLSAPLVLANGSPITWNEIKHYVRMEIVDSLLSSTGDYIVVNRYVATPGNQLRSTFVSYESGQFYDAQWQEALESIEVIDCDMVAPVPKVAKSIIFQNTLSHCRTMSNIKNKKERVLMFGAIAGLTPDNILGYKNAAVEDIGILEGVQGYDSLTQEDVANYALAPAYGNTYRAEYCYPDEIIVQAGADTIKIDGFYAGSALAGWYASQPMLAMPATNKTLSGFIIDKSKKFKPEVNEALAQAGATLLIPVQGGAKVAWGKSTTSSAYPEEQEMSIVFIRDYIAKSFRASFEEFIGLPADENFGLALSGRAFTVVTSFISQKLITKYEAPVIKQDDVDPRQWDVSVRLQPVYANNWIYIRASVGTL